MRFPRQRGSTSVMVRVFIPDNSVTNGAGCAGLTSGSTNLAIAYSRELQNGFTQITGANLVAITTIGTWANPGTGKLAFKAVDATNAPGLYEIQFPDDAAAFGTGDTSRNVIINVLELTTAALKIGPNMVAISLVPWNDQDGVRLGLTALPNAAAAGVGGLLTAPTTANVGLSDLSRILGTALTETAGLLAGGFKKFFNVATPTGTLNSIPDAVPDAAGGLPVTGNRLTAIPVVAHVTLVDTVTTYTGNTPQTGDAFARIGATGSGLTTLASAAALATVQADTDDIQTRLPAALVGGKMESNLGSVTAGVIAAASFAANALDAVWSVTARTITGGTIGTYTGNTPQTGDSFGLIGTAGAGLTALGDTRIAHLNADITSRMATYAQPAGFLAATFPTDPADESLVIAATDAIMTRLGVPASSVSADIAAVQSDTDNIQTRLPAALVGGRMDASTGAMASGVLTATAIAAGALDGKGDWNVGKTGYTLTTNVWDEVMASHLTPGTTGAALNSASAAGDPWATAIPGAYVAGTAGNILGNQVPAIKGKTDNLPTDPADESLVIAATDAIMTRLGVPASSVSGDIAALQSDTDNIQTRLPAALVGGRMASIAEVTASGAITSASFGANAIDAAALAADAVAEIQTGLGTSAALATAQADLDNIQTRLPAALVGGGIVVDAAGLRTAIGMASADLDAQLAGVPTAVENADTLLNRDMATGIDSGSPAVRTVRQALRPLRNKIAIVAGTVSVYKEDDTTTSWTAAVTTDVAALPITAVDPA